MICYLGGGLQKQKLVVTLEREDIGDDVGDRLKQGLQCYARKCCWKLKNPDRTKLVPNTQFSCTAFPLCLYQKLTYHTSSMALMIVSMSSFVGASNALVTEQISTQFFAMFHSETFTSFYQAGLECHGNKRGHQCKTPVRSTFVLAVASIPKCWFLVWTEPYLHT